MQIENLLSDISKIFNNLNIPYIEVFGNQVFMITKEDLVVSKLRWIQQLESEIHKRDIIALLQNPGIDLSYIKNWCDKLKLKTYNLFPS